MTKKVTLESLAGMVQRGFSETATKKDLEQLATKEELSAVKEDVLETRAVLARAIKDLEGRFVATTAQTREEVDRLRTWIEDIDAQIAALEGKRHRKAV